MRRRTALALLAAPLLAAACGNDEPSPAGTAAAPAGDGFPVTVQGALGTTTVPTRPERVVVVGANQDAALALGVVPVAMARFDYGGGEQGVLPWVRDALAQAGAAMPQLLGSTVTDVPLEQIAAARPDLVLATYSGLTQQQFDTLSQVAPVVAYPDAPYATSWQEQTRLAGRALGRSVEAEQLVRRTSDLLASAGSRYPTLAGTRFAYTGGLDAGQLGLFRPSDVRVRLLTDLGLQVAPFVEANAPAGDAVYYTVSAERAGELDADLLVAFFGDESEERAFSQSQTARRIPAVARGAYAPIVGQDRVVASSAPTVLSIPWVLEDYLPRLAQAAARA